MQIVERLFDLPIAVPSFMNKRMVMIKVPQAYVSNKQSQYHMLSFGCICKSYGAIETKQGICESQLFRVANY